jgi:hypothetical protein
VVAGVVAERPSSGCNTALHLPCCGPSTQVRGVTRGFDLRVTPSDRCPNVTAFGYRSLRNITTCGLTCTNALTAAQGTGRSPGSGSGRSTRRSPGRRGHRPPTVRSRSWLHRGRSLNCGMQESVGLRSPILRRVTLHFRRSRRRGASVCPGCLSGWGNRKQLTRGPRWTRLLTERSCERDAVDPRPRR